MPDDWADGDRRRGGREADAGYRVELQEPVALMRREKPKRRKPRGERTCGRLGAKFPGLLFRSSLFESIFTMQWSEEGRLLVAHL